MGQQLGLYQSQRTTSGTASGTTASAGLTESRATPGSGVARARQRGGRRVRPCAACRDKEARYGFRHDADDNPLLERPRTLCFECFRVEVLRRQAVAARLARGWNATQVSLPLSETLDRLDRRRRRAQIAARHALDLG